jgi:hypothetical protein
MEYSDFADALIYMKDEDVYNQLFKYKRVYVVQRYDFDGNYNCAVFSTKQVAIDYAKNSYSEMMKPYIKHYKKDKIALDYISKTEGYSVIMFILDAILDNKKIIFDTSDMLDSSDN